MSDPKPEACEICESGPVEIVLFPVAVHYKGSGFYSTDYGKGGRKPKDGAKDGKEVGGKDGGGSDSSSTSSSDSGSGGGDAKPDTKKAAEA